MFLLEPQVLAYAAAAYVAFAIVKTIYLGFTNPRSHIPGPWYARFTGLVHNITRVAASKHRWTQRLHEKYGPIVLIAPNEVTISHPEVHHKIHAMGSGFYKGPLYDSVDGGRARSLFSMRDPKEHAQRRKLFSRAFTQVSLRENWEPTVRQMVNLAIDQIKHDAELGTADVYKWWHLLTSDVISTLSFGESFHMLEAGEKTEYFSALKYAGMQIILKLVFGRALPLFGYLPFETFRKMTSANKIIYSQGTRAVENLRQERPECRNLFSDMLSMAESGTKAELTDDAIRSEVANMIIAGTDTTAVALTYIIWAVVKRPELRKRLEEEVAKLPPNFKDEDVERLPLLTQVIEETLRLYNPGAAPLQRAVPRGGTTLLGLYLPEGSLVTTLNWNLHREKSAFPNPEEFDETRFETPTPEIKAAYNPFMIGSRSCIGMHLAKMELRLATAQFFRECRGAKPSKNMTDEMMVQKMQFFMFPVGGKCEITLRSD